jgi:hypothetical protein
LLAANAVTASFLGAAALKGGRLDAPAGLACEVRRPHGYTLKRLRDAFEVEDADQ